MEAEAIEPDGTADSTIKDEEEKVSRHSYWDMLEIMSRRDVEFRWNSLKLMSVNCYNLQALSTRRTLKRSKRNAVQK